ncbi:hypothetical protein EYR40_000899 [Pleurotus pulmonarius]|nr:hypothetical protein EYR36_004630 [Pleurotus pulmonarius]KAF4603729.1 hypothetical protein EYR38_004144 [Pleurotus pulmonarius]KAF4608554.1 hypothetical protein EYR40_000899 [Pleurotus pulmonarius]
MVMAQRRPQHRGSHTTALDSRRYPCRRSPPQKRASAHPAPSYDTAFHEVRPVLVPLHPNLRRLPSRLLNNEKEDMTRYENGHSEVLAGSKRKRVVSRNENANGSSRGSLKRLRSVSSSFQEDSSEEEEHSAMEIDRWSESHDTETEDEESEANADSSDEHLINEAPPNQLLRMRKDELVRLYMSAGLLDDAEALTKHEIVDAIVAARDDVAELPPSSPPRGDGDSSDGSSDDGNVAGDEETDFAPRRTSTLRRRVTINDVARTSSKPLQKRSLSMGHFTGGDISVFPLRKTSRALGGDKRGSQRSDNSRRRTVSQCSDDLPVVVIDRSPPATRTRSRKVSAPAHPITPVSSTSSRSSTHNSKGKGKAKQVEFCDEVSRKLRTPTKRRNRSADGESSRREELDFGESDLTDLDDQCEEARAVEPSPRRLRSKDRLPSHGAESAPVKSSRARNKADSQGSNPSRRITPMRKAKGKAQCQREDVDEDSDEEEEEVDEVDEVDEDQMDDDTEEVGIESDEEAEVDQLVSSASATPPPPTGRRTPVKRRLRPRRVQTFTPPSDGDDEGSGGDSEDGADGEDEESGDEESSATEVAEEDDLISEPKRLRNGKVVGEDDVGMEVEEDTGEGEEDVTGEEAEDMVEDDESIGDSEADADGETDNEPSEEDVDLTIATVKTLVRLRRDDLLRLCESRDLDVVGTKPQLAAALLQWRDRQSASISSPSSTGTVRPPSTVRRRRHGKTSAQDPTTPVLMRSDRVHVDEPRTPPFSKDRVKEHEPELELDLESLGLEDREIPYEKLTKMEKIGSGGFKDVFIGKLKGKKIAIAEFRGQLSAMDIKELKLLGGFNHPNIVRFLGVSIPENTKETPVMILSELCSNGDLFDYIRNVSPPSLRKVLNIMLDIGRGLEYLHLRKPSVIHRDCKSSNILITSKGTAKIADFGLAKVKQSTRSMVRSLVGTVNWQAPELWTAHPKYNHKVDVFSCAMVYWETLQWHLPNKKFPWEGMNEHAIYDIVGAKRQRPSISGLRKQWCPEIVDLIEHMWAHEHQDRPTMSEVVERLEELIQMY